MEQFLSNLVLSDLPAFRIGRHVAFWTLCVLFFGFIYGNMVPTDGPRAIFNPVSFFEAILFLPLHIFLSYSIIYFLFPRYLFTGKYFQLLFGLIALVLLTAVFSVIIAHFLVTPWRQWMGIRAPYNSLSFGLLAGLRGSNTVAGFAAAIKLVKYWYFKKIENEQLEKEKLKAELELLKGQLQPHFLFNTLNNLYSLVLQKSDQAHQVVLRLSELLHYMLTESAKGRIPMNQEVSLIKDYIALEQMRFGSRLEMTLNIQGDFSQKRIAPLILLPFVENAFKHGTSEILEQPWVSLELIISGQELKFKLINSKVDPQNASPALSTGLGLQNVRKRLDLLYGNKYKLRTQDEPDSFLVSLQMELENG
jgi:sensor histidine kinase YesM